MDGREVERFVEFSLDGELEPGEAAELGARINESPEAKALFQRELQFRSRLKQSLRTASSDCQTPDQLKERVVARLRTEDLGTRAPAWGRMLAVTLTVSALVVVSWSTSGPALDPEEPVAKHSQNRPPEYRPRSNLEEASRFFERHLGYPVPVPRLDQHHPHVRLVGVRLDNISNRDAAYMMYDHRGARISVFAVPKPRNEGRVAPASFISRQVGGRAVVAGQHRGYNVVSFDQGAFQYLLVSDVDRDELMELVAGF
ncbi:MAG: anti-sigma factor family protein [Myxococcota bacterium]